jgi:hypothetical protein
VPVDAIPIAHTTTHACYGWWWNHGRSFLDNTNSCWWSYSDNDGKTHPRVHTHSAFSCNDMSMCTCAQLERMEGRLLHFSMLSGKMMPSRRVYPGWSKALTKRDFFLSNHQKSQRILFLGKSQKSDQNPTSDLVHICKPERSCLSARPPIMSIMRYITTPRSRGGDLFLLLEWIYPLFPGMCSRNCAIFFRWFLL